MAPTPHTSPADPIEPHEGRLGTWRAGTPPRAADFQLPELDRRRSGRESVVTVARLTTDAPDGDCLTDDATRQHDLQVVVLDVSLHGTRFRSEIAPRNGSVGSIDIRIGPLRMTSRIRIARADPLDDGTYDIGAEFI